MVSARVSISFVASVILLASVLFLAALFVPTWHHPTREETERVLPKITVNPKCCHNDGHGNCIPNAEYDCPKEDIIALRDNSLQRYKNAMKSGGTRWLYMLHLHKCMGSLMCRMAKASGFQVARGDKNCMPPYDMQRNPLNGSRSAKTLTGWVETPEVFLSVLTGPLKQTTFIANEFSTLGHALPLGLPMVYITVFRHPVERIVSNWKMDTSHRYTRPNMTLREYAVNHAYSLTLTDNYEVRMLAGITQSRSLSIAGWSAATQKALQRLDVFSSIIIMDHLEMAKPFLTSVGFDGIALATMREHNKTRLDSALWAELCHMNRWSIVVYDEAVKKSALLLR